MAFDLQPVHRTPVHRAGPRKSPALVGPAANILALQRTAGNRAVSGILAVQRQSVTVGPVGVNNRRISVPMPVGVTLQGTVPSRQTVTWSLVAGTAAIDSGTTIDTTGRVTLGATQQGGIIGIRADDPGDSGAADTAEVLLITAPGSIASTSETRDAEAGSYGAYFGHTFAAQGGGSGAGCRGGLVNEIFPAVPDPNDTRHRIPDTPFGPFILKTNNPSRVTEGWGIDSSGQMIDDDEVTIGRATINIRPFVANTSNPAPANTLPDSFSVTQDLRSLEVPTNAWRAAFASPVHVRGLRETSPGAPEFFVSANGVEHTDPYTGVAAVRNAQAATPTVAVSTPGTPNTVAITAESTPTGAPIRYRIIGAALGCRIDATTGELTIGTRTGTVRVRATIGKSFDEVAVTITS
jgi:hypothetical protein